MAKKVKKQKSLEKIVVQEEKSSRVTVKLPKKIFQYVLVLLVVAGLIYFGGKVLFV
ncbi:MAG: hypothetical protein ACD_12C00812G0001, partial [uncultured bacterium]